MGLAQGGTAIHDGDNLKIQGVSPAAIAAQGGVIWQPPQSWQLLSSVASGYGATLPTTTPMDTTGAILLVAATSEYNSTGSVTDSQTNTWVTAIGNTASAMRSYIRYCIQPATSTTHTFDFSGSYPGMVVMAFSGPLVVMDQTSTVYVGNATTVQAAPITPSAAPSLVIAIVTSTTYLGTIDSNFTVANGAPRVSGNEAVTTAYLIQSSIDPLSPTWTLLGADSFISASMATFI